MAEDKRMLMEDQLESRERELEESAPDNERRLDKIKVVRSIVADGAELLGDSWERVCCRKLVGVPLSATEVHDMVRL